MIQFDRKQLKNYLADRSPQQKNELKNFIRNNESLIDAHDFDTLYDKEQNYPYIFTTSGLTAILLLSDIDPLSYTNEIPSGCFSDLPITSIVIPEGITGIGDYAFKGCESLTSISIPEGVTEIGQYAFKDCRSLTSINIPKGVTYIGNLAFYSCDKLASISIPEGVTEIGEYTFFLCTALKSITIPNGVTKIGRAAFDSCEGLTNIILPDSVTSIDEYAFRDCRKLKNITIPKSVSKFEDNTFESCENLTSINYTGTKQDWLNTVKGHYWRSWAPIEKIICSDGEIKLRNR